MIKTVTVDDEFQGRRFLEKVIAKLFPDPAVVGTAAIEESLPPVQMVQAGMMLCVPARYWHRLHPASPSKCSTLPVARPATSVNAPAKIPAPGFP